MSRRYDLPEGDYVHQAEADLYRSGRRCSRILLGIMTIVALLYVLAWTTADAATASFTIRIVLPTTGCTVSVTPCDNAPLTGAAALTGADIFVSLSPIPDQPPGAPTHVLGAGVTTVTSSVTAAQGDTVYVRARVRNAAHVSALGAQVTTKVDLSVIPGAPIVIADTTGYQLNLGSNNKISLSRVASVPVGKPCTASSVTDPFRKVYLISDRNWAVMDPNPAKPGTTFARPRQVWAKCEAS